MDLSLCIAELIMVPKLQFKLSAWVNHNMVASTWVLDSRSMNIHREGCWRLRSSTLGQKLDSCLNHRSEQGRSSQSRPCVYPNLILGPSTVSFYVAANSCQDHSEQLLISNCWSSDRSKPWGCLDLQQTGWTAAWVCFENCTQANKCNVPAVHQSKDVYNDKRFTPLRESTVAKHFSWTVPPNDRWGGGYDLLIIDSTTVNS